MLKCLRRMLEMLGNAVLYVTTNGTISLEALGSVCNALVRELLAARRNCSSRKLLSEPRARRYVLSSLMRCLNLASVEQIRRRWRAKLNGMAFLVW